MGAERPGIVPGDVQHGLIFPGKGTAACQQGVRIAPRRDLGPVTLARLHRGERPDRHSPDRGATFRVGPVAALLDEPPELGRGHLRPAHVEGPADGARVAPLAAGACGLVIRGSHEELSGRDEHERHARGHMHNPDGPPGGRINRRPLCPHHARRKDSRPLICGRLDAGPPRARRADRRCRGRDQHPCGAEPTTPPASPLLVDHPGRLREAPGHAGHGDVTGPAVQLLQPATNLAWKQAKSATLSTGESSALRSPVQLARCSPAANAAWNAAKSPAVSCPFMLKSA